MTTKADLIHECRNRLVSGPNRMVVLNKNYRDIVLFFDNHGLQDACDEVSTPINELLHDLVQTDDVDVFVEMRVGADSHVLQPHDDSYLKRTVENLYPYVPLAGQTARAVGRAHAIDVRDMIVDNPSFPTQALNYN